ncbi:MAG: ATP synthase F1 subunit delta, partial [Candidatus Margulisbacteria bacterium]|nr:ATP synthase F1 subunit delta [Candidatus Margulisiibacteriota bacterium]
MLNYQYNLKELFDKLEEYGETDSFIRDIFRFNLLLDECFGIEETLFDAHIDAASKLYFLEDTIASHIGEYFKGFLIQLINNDDIIFYHLITKKFIDLLEKEKGCDFIEVVSVLPLSKDHLDKIQKTLEKIAQRPLYVYNSTSEELIGGFLIKFGDKTINLSLKEDLEKLKFSF